MWNQAFSGGGRRAGAVLPGSVVLRAARTRRSRPRPIARRRRPSCTRNAGGDYRRLRTVGPARNTSGTSWSAGPAAGASIPLEQFFVAKPGDDVQEINNALSRGQNLIFTPGVYAIDKTIKVKRAGTVVLGLGFATLVPQNGVVPMTVADVPGVDISGLIFDAGTVNSPVLLQGREHLMPTRATLTTRPRCRTCSSASAAPPSGKADDAASRSTATTSILDDIWAWRADHGTGVGWTVEHRRHRRRRQRRRRHRLRPVRRALPAATRCIWNGERRQVVFFQNEMPYDVPSQAAWMAGAHADGYPAFTSPTRVTSFSGYGMGSYSFFNQGVDIFAAHAFEVPDTSRRRA